MLGDAAAPLRQILPWTSFTALLFFYWAPGFAAGARRQI
jgi:hypothetical protein